MQKEVTILDIAKQLNISIATVSRALNDDPVVSVKTRKKVFDLAQELGYRQNRFAANLRQQKSHTIGVMVPKLNSNFITSVLSGIEKVATDAGYDLLIANSSETFEREKSNAINLFHKRVDGLIVSLSFDTNSLDHFLPFKKKGIPVVFFDRVEESSEDLKVIIDNYKAGYLATKHLINQGCSRIVLVTASLTRNVYAQRHRGYLDAHAERNIPLNDKYLIINDLSEQSGIDCALEILRMDPLPDGLFITNDFVAAQCMRTLKQYGILIPDDIAVVGFNNDAISRIVEPTLSTIDYPGADLGQVAARNLIDHLTGISDLKNTTTIVVKAELLMRESSNRKLKL